MHYSQDNNDDDDADDDKNGDDMMIPKFCLWFKKIKIVIVFWNDLNFAATTVTSSTNLIPVVLL